MTHDRESIAVLPVGPGQFRCAACGGVFGKLLPDAEALEIFDARFPSGDIEDTDIVCDPCFEAMKAAGVFDVAERHGP